MVQTTTYDIRVCVYGIAAYIIIGSEFAIVTAMRLQYLSLAWQRSRSRVSEYVLYKSRIPIAVCYPTDLLPPQPYSPTQPPPLSKYDTVCPPHPHPPPPLPTPQSPAFHWAEICKNLIYYRAEIAKFNLAAAAASSGGRRRPPVTQRGPRNERRA